MRKKLLLFAICLAVLASALAVPASAATNETTVHDWLAANSGLNSAAICGIMANINAESGFSPTALGDNGTSYGLCQWHNGRWTALKNYRPNDWQTIPAQLSYLLHELQTTEFWDGAWTYLTGVPDNAAGAYNAGYYFCKDFERPASTAEYDKRGKSAQNTYWPKYGVPLPPPPVITYTMNPGNGVVSGIQPGTSVSDFTAKLPKDVAGAGVSGVTNADGSAVTGNIATGMQATVTLNGGEPQTVMLIVPGDVDCNGKVNVQDALLVLQSVTGAVSLDIAPSIAADVDRKAGVSVQDALMILKFVTSGRWPS